MMSIVRRMVGVVPVLALVAGLLASCGSSTKTRIASSWIDEQIGHRSFSKILIVGVAERTEPRRIFEETLKQEILKKGVAAVGSLEIMPAEEKISREAFEKYFKDLGFDGVLLTSVRSVDEREAELRPTSTPAYMDKHGANSAFYEAYYIGYQDVHYPPEVISKRVVVVETKLFETQNGSPVWTCVSETIDPDGFRDAIASLTDAIVGELANQKFLSH